jgi:hypothetical protein
MIKTAEVSALMQAVASAMKAYVPALIEPLIGRLKALEESKPEPITHAAVYETASSVTLAEIKALHPLFEEKYGTRLKALEDRPVPTNGTDGTSVPIEDVQRMVEEAVAKRMADIRMPKDGEPGRDGAHLEILPAISQDKSYPRGTYAKHAGGLWRSFEATDGMRGWECIVDGVADVKLEAIEREFTVTTRRSSGAEEVKTISLPVMLYRGVYKEGQEYLGGDTVTWGGSLWHCDSNTADKPGELGSKGWTLAAKRGRDGKDGVNGKDYTKAVAL